MKVVLRLNEHITVEAEGQTLQELFDSTARLAEVFGQEKCGRCGGRHIRPVSRVAKGFQFFELRCLNDKCRSRFAFGQPKDVKGGLFPRLKDEDGKWKTHGGWDPPYQEHDGDDGGSNYQHEPQRQAPQPAQARPAPTDGGHHATITEQEARELKAALEVNRVDWPAFKAEYQIERLSQLPAMHLQAAYAAARGRLKGTRREPETAQ